MTASSDKKPFVNLVDSQIRAKTVLVIDGESGENFGQMPLYKALQEAKDKGLNLVQISSGLTPTCKILDYGKMKFDEQKKAKLAAKKQRESRVDNKEICFKPDTAPNDLKIKAKKVKEFLDNGDRVKVTIECKGREATHPNVFKNTLNIFLSFLPGVTAVSISNESNGKFSYQLNK